VFDEQTKGARYDPLRGSCLCGGVRFEIEGPLMRSSHCIAGRPEAHGAPFRTRARVAAPIFAFSSRGACLISSRHRARIADSVSVRRTGAGEIRRPLA